jgi:hypothetical protein
MIATLVEGLVGELLQKKSWSIPPRKTKQEMRKQQQNNHIHSESIAPPTTCSSPPPPLPSDENVISSSPSVKVMHTLTTTNKYRLNLPCLTRREEVVALCQSHCVENTVSREFVLHVNNTVLDCLKTSAADACYRSSNQHKDLDTYMLLVCLSILSVAE